MHFEWGPLLNLSLIHIIGHVSKLMPKVSVGCFWVGRNERKENRNEKYIHTQYLQKKLFFQSGFKLTLYMSFIHWSKHGNQDVFEIKFY